MMTKISKFNCKLQLKAKEDKLFETEDWYNPEYRNELIEKDKAFLIKYIR